MEFISFGVSIIGIIWLLIIGWQFVTGRPYWGEDDSSLIILFAILTSIPFLNLLSWIIFLVVIICAGIVGAMIAFREHAIQKRMEKDNEH